jgi:hypothetical protein
MWLLGVATSHFSFMGRQVSRFLFEEAVGNSCTGARRRPTMSSGQFPVEVLMGVLVSMSTLVRMVALGFALGIIVGLWFGMDGSGDAGSTACADRPAACAPAPAPATSVNPDAAPK